MAEVHDMQAARKTFDGLMRLFKLSIPLIAVIVAFVLYLLTR